MIKKLLEWRSASPIKSKENKADWDFEIIMVAQNNCGKSGCVLASAFFPDTGRMK